MEVFIWGGRCYDLTVAHTIQTGAMGEGATSSAVSRAASASSMTTWMAAKTNSCSGAPSQAKASKTARNRLWTRSTRELVTAVILLKYGRKGLLPPCALPSLKTKAQVGPGGRDEAGKVRR